MTGPCLDCEVGEHTACIDHERHPECPCAYRAWTFCDTCGGVVILWADDPGDATYSHGGCCTWGYVDYFDGTIRVDLSPAGQTSGQDRGMS